MGTMTVQSATMRRLRCESLEISRRRIADVPPTRGIAKKPSRTPPRRYTPPASPAPRRYGGDSARLERGRTPQRHSRASSTSRSHHGAAPEVLKKAKLSLPSPRTSPTPRRAAGDGARTERARTPPRRSPPAPSHHRSPHDAAAPAGGTVVKKPSAPPAPPRVSSAASDSEPIKRGEQVLVRTPVGNLPTGQVLVLWLSAVSVSAPEDDGYLRVVYNGKFPLDDPFRAVRVAGDHVKKMPPAADGASDTSTGSSTVTTAASIQQ